MLSGLISFSDIMLNLVLPIIIFDLVCIAVFWLDKATLFAYNLAAINIYFFPLEKNLYSLLSIIPL